MPRKQKDPAALSPATEFPTPSPTLLSSPFAAGKQWLRGDSVISGPDSSPAATASSTTNALGITVPPDDTEDVFLASPHEVRHGRRYLRDVPYLLPCDLGEVHRQSLRTLLGSTVFGKPACCPSLLLRPPRRVLELGCGSAFWTSTCHNHFHKLGHDDMSFTGVDLASIAPDLRSQGINWRFVQHDLRELPWPFADGEFDFIMIKDLSLAFPLDTSHMLLEECARVLTEGGNLEIWESDHVLRSLLPHERATHANTIDDDELIATQTGTYLIATGMPFAAAQNPVFVDANAWIDQVCNRSGLSATPCAIVAEMLYKESETLGDIGHRRVAIPFTELPWEAERVRAKKRSQQGNIGARGFSGSKGGKSQPNASILTPDQTAIRQTALMIVIQKIESLEPALKDISGKNADEWASWWANALANLLKQNGTLTGECLEVGAWWATKRTPARTR